MLGGALGWLVGIGALAIPGVGPFIAAGPIMAALAGAGWAGDRRDHRRPGGMGIPEFEAKRYEGMVKNGGILLSSPLGRLRTGPRRARRSSSRAAHADVSSTGERRSEATSREAVA